MSVGVTVDGLSVRFGERQVLDSIAFSLEPGQRLAVVGRSGAGKTSLLRALAGLLAPASGTITLGERVVTREGAVVVQPQDRGVGFVFQDLGLWPHMTVKKTLAWVGAVDPPALAGRVGLADRLDAYPAQLSGGEQQRLALARTLAPQPAVLLLDEPFSHLDAPLRDGLVADLLTVRGDTTLIVVTHQRRDVVDLAEQVVVLDGGRVVESGQAAGVLSDPQHAVTAALLRS